MFENMTEQEWPFTMTALQGRLIAHHRERRGLKHAELVEKVNALGLDMKRTTLVNIEQGRRKSLSVPEIYAFSYALTIPPILLLVPVGNVDSVEILRDRHVHPWVAAQWVEGSAVLDAPISGRIPPDGPLREQFDAMLSHGEILQWHRFLDELQHAALVLYQRQQHSFTVEQQKELDSKIAQVRSWRARIRDVGLIPPPFSPDYESAFPEVSGV